MRTMRDQLLKYNFNWISIKCAIPKSKSQMLAARVCVPARGSAASLRVCVRDGELLAPPLLIERNVKVSTRRFGLRSWVRVQQRSVFIYRKRRRSRWCTTPNTLCHQVEIVLDVSVCVCVSIYATFECNANCACNIIVFPLLWITLNLFRLRLFPHTPTNPLVIVLLTFCCVLKNLSRLLCIGNAIAHTHIYNHSLAGCYCWRCCINIHPVSMYTYICMCVST